LDGAIGSNLQYGFARAVYNDCSILQIRHRINYSAIGEFEAAAGGLDGACGLDVACGRIFYRLDF
jgi:hypothetical protein